MIFNLINQLYGLPASIKLAAIVGVLLAMLLALTVHEWGHAFAAYKSGDMTPKGMGRLTLNPIKHLDLLGTICILFGPIGWAKPVPVQPLNFKNPKKGIILTSIAGVVNNFIMAFLGYGIFMILLHLVPIPNNSLKYLWYLFFYLSQYMFIINISLFLFNLLPFHPLDGLHLLEGLTHPNNRVVRWLRRYGMYVLIGLILLSSLAERTGYPIDLLGYYLEYGGLIISWPIRAFWGIFF